MDTNEKLFSEFPPVTADEWKGKIIEDLKGADYDKKMIWRTNEGFNVQPFYRKEDAANATASLPGEYPYTRGNRADNKWLIRIEIPADEPAAANEKAKKMIKEGVTAIGFKVRGKIDAGTLIALLLDGIDPQATEVNFDVCQKCAVDFTKQLIAYYEKQGYALDKVGGSVNYDPIGKALCKGTEVGDYIANIKQLVDITTQAPALRTINVNSAKICNSGAYISQELGCALAWGNEYLDTATAAGIPGDVAAKNIKFNMGISSNFFMEIAKFRAARMLWAKIVDQYTPDKEAGKMIIHAETTAFNLTLFDPYVNMLRTQTEAMSAAIAGVESITVKPYDSVYETPTDFAERIAKNQQLILKHESHLDVVADPAGGSYYVESLTASIASQAWKLFLDIENEGGFGKAVESGKIKEAIEASGRERLTALARRKEILLGTNQYPNFTETAGERKPLSTACGCGCSNGEGNGLSPLRLGEEFEQLRLATEASGKRPKAFMLTIGNLAMRQARAQFSCNFLAAAGYEVIDNLGFKSVEEGAKAAMDANADIVVICSSDDEYAEYAVPAYEAVKEKAIFIVAGAPACSDELKAAGIENFIHVRVNVLDTLKALNTKLGI
ncbi:MAG: methylmalonyl-CoA mutase small subunit [Bacteroidaceae bacterium]|nr:methylmalonyl-CoA mutase small subunit [Bacteroidaceae bacterium]